MMNWYLKVMKSYFTSKGRATRSEYWYFMLFFMLIIFVPSFIIGFLGFDQTEYKQIIIFIIIGIIVIHIIPSITVSIRRLHDIGKSGWWYLVSFIPYVGSSILMILAMIDSKEDNEYGVNPKG